MKIKNIYLTILTIFSLSILFVPSNIAKADFRAGPAMGGIEVICDGGCNKSDVGRLQLVGYLGDLGISVYSKPFNFIRTDNGSGLQNGDWIPTGTQLNFNSYGSAIGSWWISGGGYDTPDMNGVEYPISGARSGANPRIRVNPPNTSDPISITGQGAVTCNGLTCSATREGSASITVTFPGDIVGSASAPKYESNNGNCKQSQNICTNVNIPYSGVVTDAVCIYPKCNPNQRACNSSTPISCTCPNGGTLSQQGQIVGKPGNLGGDAYRTKWVCTTAPQQQQICKKQQVAVGDCGQDTENINYGNHDVTIYFNVIRPNTAPTVTYTNTTDISFNTAKANWTYRDNEGDPQVDSHIQLAVDANFNSIVFNSSQGGQSNNFNLIDLIPGTTYYPRVRSQDSRGAWSDWSNGQAFTTLANTPPNIADFGCSVSKVMTIPDKYTTANVKWNYTGPDQDAISLSIRAIKDPNGYPIITNVNNAAKSDNINIGGLEPGAKYNIQIAVTDIYNGHITDQIQNCGNIDIDQYPDPKVIFTLSNGNKTSIAQTGGTLTIGQSDGVLASWDITDNFGLIDNSCKITTTSILGGVNSQIFNQSGLGFTITDLPGQNIPQVPQDLEYKINLKCEGKNANPKKEVNENIILRILSVPVVSCNLNKKVVDIDSSTVDLTANIGNVSGYYDFKIGRNLGESPIDSGRISSITNNQSILNKTIDYKGIPFGTYRPWIEITSKSGKIVSKNCGNITNFGNSKIKEVNP
jgi:hypothetical protein